MDKLKPCPFCGCGETVVRTSDHWTGQQSVVLSATVQHHCKDKPFQNLLQVKGKTVDEAVEKWNTRTEDKRIAELELSVAFHHGNYDQAVEDVAYLEAKLDAVRPYIQHKPDCEVGSDEHQYADMCDCGLQQALGENKEP